MPLVRGHIPASGSSSHQATRLFQLSWEAIMWVLKKSASDVFLDYRFARMFRGRSACQRSLQSCWTAFLN